MRYTILTAHTFRDGLYILTVYLERLTDGSHRKTAHTQTHMMPKEWPASANDTAILNECVQHGWLLPT